MKVARIRKKHKGTVWELRAGKEGKGRLIQSCVGVIPSQERSREHALDCLHAAAEREGFRIVSEWERFQKEFF